jgi:hypothetical protein
VLHIVCSSPSPRASPSERTLRVRSGSATLLPPHPLCPPARRWPRSAAVSPFKLLCVMLARCIRLRSVPGHGLHLGDAPRSRWLGFLINAPVGKRPAM